MSVVGLFAVQCERCGEQGPAATDLTSARVASTSAGWAIVREQGSAFDYCPDHVGRARLIEAGRRLASERDDLIADGVDPAALLVPDAPAQLWACPECEQGKHGNCDGWAWDFDADEKTQCQCPEVHS